ncbi:MAG: rhodanese-like domain-containing protein [Acidimicrobiales bacterium]|nr:rhodanese-like domain-containing protein [Acidimicrobiales bacterium]
MIEHTEVPEVDVEELKTKLADGANLLDVRELEEVEEVRVPGGIYIPLQSIPERLNEIPVLDTLYVICALGGRSRTAAEFLRLHNVDAVNVAGGTSAWMAADYPTESGRLSGGAS